MTATLSRSALEPVEVELQTGTDGQGLPAYAEPVRVNAKIARTAVAVRGPAGEEIQTTVTLWVPAPGAAVLPDMDSRITLATGWTGIVVERADFCHIRRGGLEHVRVRLREE